MERILNTQLGMFLVYACTGIIICVLFDIFRALRKTIKTSDILTYIEDIIFWTITAAILIYITFILNSGHLRAYTYVGLILGIIIYYLAISKFFMKVSVAILKIIKDVITKVIILLLIPIKFILKINKKLIYFICINFKNVTKIFKKFSKTPKPKKGFLRKM